MKNRFLISLLTTLVCHSVHSAVLPLVLTSEDSMPSARWMFTKPEVDKKDPTAKLKFPIAGLVLIKRAQLAQDFAECLSESQKVWSKVKGLDPWLMVVRMDCATLALEDKKKNATPLIQALGILEKNPDWLLQGAYATELKRAAVAGRIALLDNDVKTNHKRGWESIEVLSGHLNWLDDSERADYYRLTGDLCFAEQKFEAAHDFYTRSLKDADSSDLRKKIEQLEAGLGAKKIHRPDKVVAKDSVSAQNELGTEELDLVNRISFFIKGSDFLAGVSEAVKLIQKFPGSSRAKWAQDRVIETYLNIVDKNDEKYDSLRRSIFNQMQLVDNDRLVEWGKTLLGRGQYADSLEIIKKAMLTTELSSRSTKIFEMAASAAYFQDKFDEALSYYKEIILRHAGTPSFREALFRSGLITFRLKEYAQSAGFFERLLAVPQSDNYELMARYWLWRSLQKTNSPRAPDQIEALVQKFPLSYYGIRARIEKDGGFFEMPAAKKEKFEAVFWSTNQARMGWERIQLLLQAGWLDEAQAEIKELPTALTAEEKALRSRLYASALNYGPAIKLIGEAWDEEPTLRQEPFWDVAFPKEFQQAVDENAKLRGLSPYLVRALIKQESAFQVKAISSSNALGLMQMIPPTAKEIASDLKIASLNLPEDMFEPSQNIQMGTYYLSKVLKQFNQHVPLTLAAYNAGPARIERWIKARPSLARLMEKPSSEPEDEIWFDELPWAETSFYVKAILRNYILYQSFDQGRVSISNPIWSQAK